jgi:predicted dehydrogenase
MIGIAVIGYGYWGPNLARCFAETNDCRLVAIADPSSVALARAGKRHPSVRLLSDWREVLNDPEVDAIAVATPVRTHYEIAAAALAAGRHVLVEKPMTESAEQGRLLVEQAARRGLALMVGHTFIYSSAVRKMRELIASGELGDVLYYDSTRINLGLFQRDVNVIWDLAVHDLSILEFILDGTPIAISANGVSHVRGSPENMAHVTLYYEGGTVAHLNVSWLAPVKIRQVLVGGSRKMIVYDDLNPSEKIRVYDSGVNLIEDPAEIYQRLISYRVGDMWAPRLSASEPMLTETEHFVTSIRDRTTPITDGRLGLRVVETLEAASQSMRQRGHPVEFAPLRIAS